MRSPRIVCFFLILVSLSVLPLPAQALLIQFCSPACTGTDADPAPTVFGPGQPTTDENGVTTNTMSLGTFTHTRGAKSFTITATVTSQQSATLQKITFNPTSITATTGSTCSTGDPCKIEVIATSDQFDFPAPKPSGGYPAGAFMIGSFTGPQAASPNGDSISSTGEASGARLVTVETSTGTAQIIEPVAIDVVNATPNTDPGNTGQSLPSTCTGQLTCKFIASTFKKGFSTQITETVQQQCDDGAASCLTRLQTRLNIELKTPGNRVSLPYDWVTTNVNPAKPEVNPTEQLISNIISSIGNLDVNSLAVGPNHFVVNANLSLGTDASIDPVTEEVYVRVGPFSLSILPGLFKRLQDGRVFTFYGKVDERQVNATFARDRTNAQFWNVIIAVYGVQLTGLPQPPLEVPVDVGVGSKIGQDLVTARFFGTAK